MRAPFGVPASGTISYQNFEIPTNFTEDKWVQAIEVRAGAPSVVHHVLVYSREPDPTPRPMPWVPAAVASPDRPPARGATREPASAAPRGAGAAPAANRSVIVGMLAPHTNPQKFEPGQAMLIRAGAVLRLQVHYTTNGKATSDQSSIGIIFAKQPPRQEVFNAAFMTTSFAIPPGATDHRVDSAIEFTADAHIIGLVPHTHLRGKHWEYRLVRPDGRSEVVSRYPLRFQLADLLRIRHSARGAEGLEARSCSLLRQLTREQSESRSNGHGALGRSTWEEMRSTAVTFTVDDQNPRRADRCSKSKPGRGRRAYSSMALRTSGSGIGPSLINVS